jgi:spore maturation protein CgeB
MSSAIAQPAEVLPPAPRPLPRDLQGFTGYHAGETILVCGCGSSLSSLVAPERFVTIGVNDVGRQFQPDYLVVLNPRQQFSGDRFRFVERSRAKAVFTQLDLGISHPHIVRFRLGKFAGVDFSDRACLNHTRNSPYLAMCLAVHMGAKRIGLIGVDFTADHFFAATGQHPLARQFSQIDAEYKRLYDACRRKDIDVFNLSASSRLTALPKRSLEEFTLAAQAPGGRESVAPLREPAAAIKDRAAGSRGNAPRSAPPRVFCVNYRFLSCGDVFTIGLQHAADQLGLVYQDAHWDEARLPAKIERFQPDLLFVVHGRRFVQRWGNRFSRYQTAVWLTDEPYEVDDTSRWSGAFKTVFLCDPATASRHRNAHYLPVAFDPRLHCDHSLSRGYEVGFVGGYNSSRERYLEELAGAGLLSYVVGGPWRSDTLKRLCLGSNVPPERTAELYRQTRIVLNVFREVHHFNREAIPACSMNPRIYEALACGSLVVSERRPELSQVFPDLPLFDSPSSLIPTLRRLLADDPYRRELVERNRLLLRSHSYSQRLLDVLRICLGIDENSLRPLPTQEEHSMASAIPVVHSAETMQPSASDACAKHLPQWTCYGLSAHFGDDAEVLLSKPHEDAPGSETGLASLEAYNDVELSFDLQLDADAWFLAKIHQLDRIDQGTNSYHLVSQPGASYLAKHHAILHHISLERGMWQRITLRWVDQLLELLVNGSRIAAVMDNQLQSGYCFIGLKGGSARVKEVKLHAIPNRAARRRPVAAISAPRRKGTSETDRARDVCPLPGKDIWPFGTTPRRNLLYHIWPVRGSMWQWNLEQLKNRLDLFNGHRIVSIVEDVRSEPAESVQRLLEGHGCEFVIAGNDSRGEAINFPEMIKKAISPNPEEVTFYGHAKGVKYEPAIPEAVRRWAEVQYQVGLDDWLSVRGQLQQFAMTGPFKMLGQFHAHRRLADWHYSGTYFWMRNAHIFRRKYQEVPQFYGGVETWPGTMFRLEETGCLFMDNLRQLPYHKEFWRNAEAAFVQWKSSMQHIAPPEDLLHPLPYKGMTYPRMEQKPDEFEWWLDRLLRDQVTKVLTIGSKEGGCEWHVAREFAAHGRKIEITAIEKDPHPELANRFIEAERQFGQRLKLVIADSTSTTVRERLSPPYDAVFIDGDHSFNGCRSDFALARELGPRLIGLHDIVDSDWHAHARCCVSRLWSELSQRYSTETKASGQWGGIGIVTI